MCVVAANPLRVVVVDDSVLMRTLLRSALEVDGDIEVAGTAGDPFEARDVIKKLNPDVLTLDVEMPGMNGLEFLEKIMTLRPMPVVMVSSLTSAGAEASLTALDTGAVDFIAKPPSLKGANGFGAQLRDKVRAARGARLRSRTSAAPTDVAASVAARPAVRRSPRAPQLIAIGASTGGVTALRSLVGGLPKGLPPIVCVIHMPPQYTGRFATRLADETGHDVAEARHGERLETGMIRIAPGDQHVKIVKQAGGFATRLEGGELVSGHRPSVDVCFDSVGETVGSRALGVILTGMGRDGAKGMLKMREAGAICLGEAESSCVVYGMPKAAREAGGVNEEHDLGKLPGRLCELVSGETVRV